MQPYEKVSYLILLSRFHFQVDVLAPAPGNAGEWRGHAGSKLG